MAVASSVLLFLIGFCWLVYALLDRFDPLALLFAAVSIACGVLNLALPVMGIRILVGVMLGIWALASFGLFVKVVSEGTRGPGRGIVIAASIGSFLLFAWIATFAVLQFAVVV